MTVHEACHTCESNKHQHASNQTCDESNSNGRPSLPQTTPGTSLRAKPFHLACVVMTSAVLSVLLWHNSQFIQACSWGDCPSAGPGKAGLRSSAYMSKLQAVGGCPISSDPPLAQVIAGQAAASTNSGLPGSSARHVHATSRPFPKVFVIGAQKCGTSTLWNMFEADANVRVAWTHDMSAKSKELHFFDRKEDVYEALGLDWYLKHWDYVQNDTNWRDYVMLDATPDYLVEGHTAPRRIVEAFPAEATQLRFIVMLCNPMERAYSLWTMAERSPWNSWAQSLPLADGFGAFAARYLDTMKACVQQLPLQQRSTDVPEYQRCMDMLPDLFYRGLYWPQLAVWLQYFAREQFLLIDSKQLFGPSGLDTQTRIRQHVGLPLSTPFMQPAAWESAHQSLASDDPATYRMLNHFYEPFTQLLVHHGGLCGFNLTSILRWHGVNGSATV